MVARAAAGSPRQSAFAWRALTISSGDGTIRLGRSHASTARARPGRRLLTLFAFAAFARLPPEEVARLAWELDHDHARDVQKEAAVALSHDPTDLAAHWLYASAVAQGPALRRPLRETYRRWLAEDPEDPVRRVTMAYTEPLDLDSTAHHSAIVPSKPGPWCDPTLAWLDRLPDDPDNRHRALYYRRRIEIRCDRDHAATDAAILALADEVEAARYAATIIRLERGVVDDPLATGIAWVLAHQPWRVDQYDALWGDGMTGPGLEAARSAVVETAKAAVTRREPYLADAGREALATANRREGRMHARNSDPVLDAMRAPDPANRLIALRRAEDDLDWNSRPGLTAYWQSRAEAAKLVGDADDAFRSLRILATWSDDVPSNIEFVRMAVQRRQHLGRAARVADWAVRWLRDPGWWAPSFVWDPYALAHRAQLADALDARAAVHHLRGQRADALTDAWEAALLEDLPRHQLRLGVTAHLAGRDDLAVTALARAFSGGPLDDPASDEGMTDLAALRPGTPIPVPEATTTARPGEPFPDLSFEVAGQERRLSSFPGVVVVGLWGTACAPCRLSLPALDALAARHHGAVTVVALSVDSDRREPSEYLDKASPWLVGGWLGDHGPKEAGVDGLPAIFVLDRDHRLTGFAGGYRPADHRVDDAVAAALSRP